MIEDMTPDIYRPTYIYWKLHEPLSHVKPRTLDRTDHHVRVSESYFILHSVYLFIILLMVNIIWQIKYTSDFLETSWLLLHVKQCTVSGTERYRSFRRFFVNFLFLLMANIAWQIDVHLGFLGNVFCQL